MIEMEFDQIIAEFEELSYVDFAKNMKKNSVFNMSKAMGLDCLRFGKLLRNVVKTMNWH